MTEEDIKEALSKNYVGILAHRKGCQLSPPTEKDYGIDCSIRYDIYYTMPNGEKSRNTAPYVCDLQLKATTSKSIKIKSDYIIYKLKAKNYNDLISRRKFNSNPLVLILFILPDSKSEWVKVLNDELILSKNAYWYYPLDSEECIKNSYSKSIQIPLKNKLDLNFFDNQIKQWIPEWKLPT